MAPLVLPLRFSPSLIAALTVVHVLPCIVALGAGVPSVVRIAVMLLVLISIAFQCWKARHLASMQIELRQDGSVFLVFGEERRELAMLPSSADLNVLIVLHWHEQISGRLGRCTLTRDSLGADAWRRLRIWLRWHAGLQKQDSE
ncbi:MAG TPA: protein YgfX [Rhodocyclaceae bacterium]|nr:protein YgfX [Rhodocyclaceae bacterium]